MSTDNFLNDVELGSAPAFTLLVTLVNGDSHISIPIRETPDLDIAACRQVVTRALRDPEGYISMPVVSLSREMIFPTRSILHAQLDEL